MKEPELHQGLGNPSAGAQGWWQSPLALLVATFLLTGVVGTWLTSYWSNSQWENQQAYLREQQALKERYTVLGSVIQAIAATTAAASDIATMGYWNWDLHDRKRQIDERRKEWADSSRSWRIQSRVLLQSLAVHFHDPAIPDQFTKIVNVRRQLGQKVRALLETYDESKDDTSRVDERRKLAEKINGLANEIDKQTRGLGTALRQELLHVE